MEDDDNLMILLAPLADRSTSTTGLLQNPSHSIYGSGVLSARDYDATRFRIFIAMPFALPTFN